MITYLVSGVVGYVGYDDGKSSENFLHTCDGLGESYYYFNHLIEIEEDCVGERDFFDKIREKCLEKFREETGRIPEWNTQLIITNIVNLTSIKPKA